MMGCCYNICPRCKGAKWLVVGLLVLANAFWNIMDWWVLLGILIALKGLIMLLMPDGCKHCSEVCNTTKGKRK